MFCCGSELVVLTQIIQGYFTNINVFTKIFCQYSPGLLHRHWGNHMIAPAPVKHSWGILVNRSHDSWYNHNKTKQNKTMYIFYGIYSKCCNSTKWRPIVPWCNITIVCRYPWVCIAYMLTISTCSVTSRKDTWIYICIMDNSMTFLHGSAICYVLVVTPLGLVMWWSLWQRLHALMRISISTVMKMRHE